MKIIIQAGGLGTRMKQLAKVKPKSLIPAQYLPIIFHLFEKYKSDEFIIIGDFKFDVFDRYLSTFAKDVKYILLRSHEKGNAAGIKDAVAYIPPDEPFMIIWSDIILSEQFSVREIREGCQVGIVDFPCSWSLVDGRLVNEMRAGNGVAGLYVFDSNAWFDDFPIRGSFTHWLAEKRMPLTPISLMGSIDVGTLEAFNRTSNNANRCRPYNKIEFIDGRVVKSGLTQDAVRLIEREVVWYSKMTEYGFDGIPRIYSHNPLTMEIIRGTNVFAADLDDAARRRTLDQLLASLTRMHRFESKEASAWDLYAEYFTKTIQRLLSVASAIPFAYDPTITINGVECLNVIRDPHRLRAAVLNNLMSTRYVPIHGDCQLTNTMISKDGQVYFIDPRGYFGSSIVLGDVRYDWAKVYYAISGNFDQYNIKNFELDITDRDVSFAIGSGGWEYLTDEFMSQIPQGEGSPKELKLIHAIVWLSLTSHAWEDFDSMCVAFYNGTALLTDWMREFGHDDKPDPDPIVAETYVDS